MAENIKVGDVVIGTFDDISLPDYGCKLLMMQDNRLSVKEAMILNPGPSFGIYHLTEEVIKFYRNRVNVDIVTDVDNYIGQCIVWVHCKNLIVKHSGNNTRSYPRICVKCGQFDEYACPSPKHNGEVRCYLHCE